MKVTMYNTTSKVTIEGIDVKYVEKWQKLGFEVQSYEDSNIIAFRKAS